MTIEDKILLELKLNYNKIKNKKIIIFPYGQGGRKTVELLKIFNLKVEYIIDNNLSQFNNEIYTSELFENLNLEEYIILIACNNGEKIIGKINDVYGQLAECINLINNYEKFNIYTALKSEDSKRNGTEVGKIKVGKWINCNSDNFFRPDIQTEVGNYVQIAFGAAIVVNHEIYNRIMCGNLGINESDANFKRGRYKETNQEGVEIGNDVWLGRNVIVTQGVKIGDGAVIGAGAIVTKDIPDYAVAVGNPAKVIKYRYTEEQIEILQRIKWWNWTEEKIKNNYHLFFNIDEFFKKLKNNNE